MTVLYFTLISQEKTEPSRNLPQQVKSMEVEE
jgi:hypothetical protein